MNKAVVVEFAGSISEEELYSLTNKLSERIAGDLSEAALFMSRYKAMDSILSSAKSADDFYDLCDQIRDVLQKECKKRNK